MKTQHHSLARALSLPLTRRGGRWAGLFLAALLAPAADPAQAGVTEAWVKRYDNAADNLDDIPQAVAFDSSGNLVVTGSSASSGGDEDYYTAKYAAADGALLWEKRYNGPGNSSDFAVALGVDSSGNVVVAGASVVSGFNFDYYTARYAAADGALLWEKRYNGTANAGDFAQALALDSEGNAVVTGNSSGSGGTKSDYYTAKYAAANGALLWEKRYNGPANGSDQAVAVAVDGSGNVVVTGNSTGSSGYPDYYTAKYAAANGALLWEQRYNGPANGTDLSVAVAVDANGNVVATGSSKNASNEDFYTAKYAAANGALLWEQRYNGPANGADAATALAVDASGNVVVTGNSVNANGDTDYYTAKYAAANGALLWEKRYASPSNEDDLASAVAVAGNGDVVVTGSSLGVGNGDYYTAKYAAADGRLLWEQRYNGPANGDDVVSSQSCLALDLHGKIAVTGYSAANAGPIYVYDYATVLYLENLPPVIACAPNLVTNCASSAGHPVEFTVMATDDSGLPPNLICLPPSGALFPMGQTTVTCTATDADLASSSCMFTVTVADLENPTLAQPADLTKPTDFGQASAAVTFPLPEAQDNCSAVVVVCLPPSGSNFPLGISTVTCTATDTANNKTNTTFKVTVTDHEKPVINCPANFVRVNDAGGCSAVVSYTVTASDNVPGVTFACLSASGSVFPMGATTVHCSASDISGNQAACSFMVTVVDKTSPAVTAPPQSRTINLGDTVTFSVGAVSCGPLTYQWFFGVTALNGENQANLTLTSVARTDAGNYTVEVSNSRGTTSAAATLTVNRPPVARDDGGSTPKDEPFVISIAQLLANDSDPDGDPLSLTAVSAASTKGGSVALGATSVTYSPPARLRWRGPLYLQRERQPRRQRQCER